MQDNKLAGFDAGADVFGVASWSAAAGLGHKPKRVCGTRLDLTLDHYAEVKRAASRSEVSASNTLRLMRVLLGPLALHLSTYDQYSVRQVSTIGSPATGSGSGRPGEAVRGCTNCRYTSSATNI